MTTRLYVLSSTPPNIFLLTLPTKFYSLRSRTTSDCSSQMIILSLLNKDFLSRVNFLVSGTLPFSFTLDLRSSHVYNCLHNSATTIFERSLPKKKSTSYSTLHPRLPSRFSRIHQQNSPPFVYRGPYHHPNEVSQCLVEL